MGFRANAWTVKCLYSLGMILGDKPWLAISFVWEAHRLL